MTARLNAARKAVGDSGAAQRLIRTVHRKGVRFVAEVQDEAPPPGSVAATIDAAAAAASALLLPDKPSIAVLPFQNISGDREQEYFADGMVEEIITALSRIRWLFVIAHKSTFAYRRQAMMSKQVGRKLGVRYVLEGRCAKTAIGYGSPRSWSKPKPVRIYGPTDSTAHSKTCSTFRTRWRTSVAGMLEPALQVAEDAPLRRSSDGRPYGL